MDESTTRRVIELAESYNAPTIAKMVGIGKRTVYRIFNEHNINTGRHRSAHHCHVNGDTERQICELYGNTPTIDIANRLNISKTTIYNVCRRHGIARRTRTRGLRDYHGTDEVDVFNQLDSPEKLYIAGLICADGTLHGDVLSITLKQSDRYLLENIRRYIGYGVIDDISISRPYKGGASQPVVSRLRICRRRIVEDLKKHGVEDFKNDRFSFNLNDREFRYFTLGFFDGDGVASSQVGFVGTRGVMEAIRDRVYNLCGIYANVLKRGSICRFQYGSHKDINSLVEWLYGAPLPAFFLRRKYNRIMRDHKDWESVIGVVWGIGNRFTVDTDYLSYPSQEIERMRGGIAQRLSQSWIPPSYSDTELKNDLDRCRNENLNSYYHGTKALHSTAPNPGGMPGRKIMTHFNPHFWDISGDGRKPIPEMWDYDNIHKCLGISIREKESLSLERIFREMFFHCNCFRTSLFAPGLARHVYRMFGPIRNTFDPCGGWGGRMIGAHLENIGYECTEISPQTYHGLCDIRDFIGSENSLINVSCLEHEWPDSDLIFTSPPYYNAEEYVGGDQPHKLESRESWIEGFVEPFMNKRNSRCVLYLNEETLNDFSSIEKPKNVLDVKNRKHPRATVSKEFLVEW